MDFQQIINKNENNVALIIGNGINQYEHSNGNQSWKKLLLNLWNKFRTNPKSRVPEGLSLCEFYDILELSLYGKPNKIDLQEEFCKETRNWYPTQTHHKIVNWAIIHQIPILTTNFDNTLSKAGNCSMFRFNKDRFTDYYPWESYFSVNELLDPLSGFGIWHINGMQQYYRSLRLGLTHYMGSVERVRNWLHKGNESSLFFGKDNINWRGAFSWTQIIFNKPLIIFGLGLDYNEVFLRWLLIERQKYFQKFPDRAKPAWYIYPKSEQNDKGKLFFLKWTGVKPIMTDGFDDIYKLNWG